MEKVHFLVLRWIYGCIQRVFGDIDSNELRKMHKFVVFSSADAILYLTQMLLLDHYVYDSKRSSQYGERGRVFML